MSLNVYFTEDISAQLRSQTVLIVRMAMQRPGRLDVSFLRGAMLSIECTAIAFHVDYAALIRDASAIVGLDIVNAIVPSSAIVAQR